jgi:hypothetical protein
MRDALKDTKYPLPRVEPRLHAKQRVAKASIVGKIPSVIVNNIMESVLIICEPTRQKDRRKRVQHTTHFRMAAC